MTDTMTTPIPPPRRLGSRVHTQFLHGTITRVIDPATTAWREWPTFDPPRPSNIPLLPPLLPLCHTYYLVQPDRLDLKPHIVRHDEI